MTPFPCGLFSKECPALELPASDVSNRNFPELPGCVHADLHRIELPPDEEGRDRSAAGSSNS